jgi:hypothetical protein
VGLGKDSYHALPIVPFPNHSFPGTGPDGWDGTDLHRLQNGGLGIFECVPVVFTKLDGLGQEGRPLDSRHRFNEAKHDAPFEFRDTQPNDERCYLDSEPVHHSWRQHNSRSFVPDDVAGVHLSDSTGSPSGEQHGGGRPDGRLRSRTLFDVERPGSCYSAKPVCSEPPRRRICSSASRKHCTSSGRPVVEFDTCLHSRSTLCNLRRI